MTEYSELKAKAEGVIGDITLYEFYAVAQPEVILEMIAELDRLGSLVDDLQNHIMEMGERDE